MKHFFANLVAMFFINKNLRRRIRNKIMGVSNKSMINNIDTDPSDNYRRLKSEWLVHNNGELPLPGRFSEYDLFFCIGATCHGTIFLDKFNLRYFSSPFDWTEAEEPDFCFQKPDIYRDSRFREKIQAICNGFQNWANPQDFRIIPRLIFPYHRHHCVINIKTKVRYVHEFPVDMSIEQHMPDFIEKTERRKKYLFNAIDKSQKICVLWLASVWDQRTRMEQSVSDEEIKWAVNGLQKKYPNKIFDFIFFEQDGSKSRFEYEKTEVVPGAYRIKSNHFLIDNEYNFAHPRDTEHPHIHVVSEMLDNVCLSKQALSYLPTITKKM